MKKIAIPVDEDGRLYEHFGHCKWLVLMDVVGSEIVFAENIVPPPHGTGLLPRWLAENGVTDIIVANMGKKQCSYLINMA
jgi:predicted Fe-Mo cluster-binding NifX family protein